MFLLCRHALFAFIKGMCWDRDAPWVFVCMCVCVCVGVGIHVAEHVPLTSLTFISLGVCYQPFIFYSFCHL